VKEDLDDCPDDSDYNLVLLFEYLDADGNDVFAGRINNIDVAIYDENHDLYQWINVDEVVSDPERIKRLKVDPGIYYIDSWANDVSFRQNRMLIPEGEDDLDHMHMYNSFSTSSCDQLHFAPDLRKLEEGEDPEDLRLYVVEVAPEGTTLHTLSYMGAYHTIEVYLKGFPEIETGETDQITVSITHLARYYDSFLHHEEEDMVYRTNAIDITVDEELLGFSSFHVPHFENDSEITIEIDGLYDSGRPYHFSVTMNEALRILEMIVIDGGLQTIPIVIEFKDTFVELILPDWLVIDVEPGYN